MRENELGEQLREECWGSNVDQFNEDESKVSTKRAGQLTGLSNLRKRESKFLLLSTRKYQLSTELKQTVTR